MAISMTGFGRGEYKDDNYQFLVECKTINHKYADINIRLPRKLSFLEDKARILVKDYIKWGRVDLYIKLDLLGSEDVNLKFDEELATQYVSILKQIKDKFDLVDDISVMNIAKFPDVIKTEEKEDDEDKLWSMLKVALENALLKLKEMRSEEGKKLAEDIQNRCDLLKNYIEDIEKYSYNVVIDYKEKLKNTVVKNESIGRKIDFLIQEMNRETNTIGSKSSDLNITNLVVEVKSELEKIREQIQNIE